LSLDTLTDVGGRDYLFSCVMAEAHALHQFMCICEIGVWMPTAKVILRVAIEQASGICPQFLHNSHSDA
jgi:hypothetical protein